MAVFQKRHYIRLAETLNSSSHRNSAQWKAMVRELADMLSSDNDSFDRDRFIYACDTGEVLGRNIHGGPAMQYGPTSGSQWNRKLNRGAV